MNAALVAIHCDRVQERRNLSEWCEAGLADVVGDAVVVEGEVALVRMVPEAAWVTACVSPACYHSKKGTTDMVLYAARFAKSGRMIYIFLAAGVAKFVLHGCLPYEI